MPVVYSRHEAGAFVYFGHTPSLFLWLTNNQEKETSG